MFVTFYFGFLAHEIFPQPGPHLLVGEAVAEGQQQLLHVLCIQPAAPVLVQHPERLVEGEIF